MIKPTIGRKVWFRPGPHDDLYTSDPQPFDATVVYVHNDRLVNLTVADHNGYTTARISVDLVQPEDRRPAPIDGTSYCEWMPFQIGQPEAVKEAQAQVTNSGKYPESALAGSGTFEGSEQAPAEPKL